MLVIVWAVALMLLVVHVVRRCARRGAVCSRAIREDEDATAALGKNVFSYKLQSLAVGAALGAIAGLFYAYQFSFFSPGDSAARHLLRLDDRDSRRHGAGLGVPVGAIVFGVIFAGTRFFDVPAVHATSTRPKRAYLRLVIIGLILIALMAFQAAGDLREEGGPRL